MKYRITIEEIKPQEKNYQEWQELFQQQVEEINWPVIIWAINYGLTCKAELNLNLLPEQNQKREIFVK